MPKPTFIESLTALSDGYGPLIELAFPGRMLLLASNHAFIQEICDDTRFEKAVDGPAVLARETVGDGLFTAYNDEPAWGVAHNILMPAFSQKAMQGYVSMMTDITRQLLHRRRENPAAMAESRDLLSAMLTGVDSVTGGRISDTNAR